MQNVNFTCITLPSVACPALQYFFPFYFINGTIFEKKTFSPLHLPIIILLIHSYNLLTGRHMLYI